MKTKEQIQAEIDFKLLCSKIHCENKILASQLGFFKSAKQLHTYNVAEEKEAQKNAEEIQQLYKELYKCKM